jgi:hypothetical protein
MPVAVDGHQLRVAAQEYLRPQPTEKRRTESAIRTTRTGTERCPRTRKRLIGRCVPYRRFEDTHRTTMQLAFLAGPEPAICADALVVDQSTRLAD